MKLIKARSVMHVPFIELAFLAEPSIQQLKTNVRLGENEPFHTDIHVHPSTHLADDLPKICWPYLLSTEKA